VSNGDDLYIKINKIDGNLPSDVEVTGTILWVVVTILT
jgi:hypothetical protein